MEVTEKLKILDSFLGDHKKVGNEYLYFCPLCSHHKRKLSLNLSKGKYKCWICDVSGNIRKLVRSKGTYEMFSRWKQIDGDIDLGTDINDLFADIEKKEEEILTMPESFATLTSNLSKLKHSQPQSYLSGRGLSKEDILYWKIGYCYDGEYKDRVVIPSFNLKGNLNFFVSRRVNKSVYPTYKLPEASKDIIFNELYLDFDRDLVVTEGVFDAMKAGQNSVPLLGSTLHEENKLFQKIVKHDTPVYMALDPDARKKENEIIRSFIGYGIDVYKVDISGYKDAGEMTKEEFKKRKDRAILMNHEKLLQQELGVN